MDPKRSKPVIGLVGGIGAGKSSVAAVFQSLGAAVIDADRLAHDLLDEPDVQRTLRTWWGDDVCPDNVVDRKKVAAKVFADPAELRRLEGLLYPRIHERRAALMAELEADPAVRAVVLDTPKLVETGLDGICDAVVFVEADRARRLERVSRSRGWTEAEWVRREKLQNSLDNKRAKADYVIVNHAETADLRPQVERVLTSILATFT